MTANVISFDGTLAVIGGGRMGEAIFAGLIAAGAVGRDRIVVAEPVEARRAELAAIHRVACVATAAEALPGAAIVLVAVKPQVFDAVLAELVPNLPHGALVISIAAGLTCARIESSLPAGTPVVRVMPNTPALVGEGMAVISGGTEATAQHVELARSLFAAIGRAEVIAERYQDAATALSGSGPAYFALIVDALARAGVRQGLTRDIAERLVVQTMRGTAELLERSGQHPEQLADAVASPGGTTIAALHELEAHGVRAALGEAVDAAVARAKELGS